MIEHDILRDKGNEKDVIVKAYDVAKSLNLKELGLLLERVGEILNLNPLIASLGSNRYISIFEYGSIVFFNLTDASITGWLENIKPYASRLNKRYLSDEIKLIINPNRIDDSKMTTEELSISKLDKNTVILISIILSRSVTLEYYEHLIDQALASLEDEIQRLSQDGKINRKPRYLTKQVGFALAVEHELAYNLEILDDPDVVWEGEQEIDRLFKQTTKLFDLKQRTDVIEKKLSLIARSSEFIISRLDAQKSAILELAIIFLILAEILIFFSIGM